MRRIIRLGKRLPPRVTAARLNIERWRRTRIHRAPMPETLWSSAVALAREYSVCSVARTLRIDYKALRVRATDAGTAERTASAGFIELLSPPSVSVPAPRETVLECSDGSGMKIHLRQTGDVDIDVIRLVDVFRNGAR